MKPRIRNWMLAGATLLSTSLVADTDQVGYRDSSKGAQRNMQHQQQQNMQRSPTCGSPATRGCASEIGFFTDLSFLYWRAQNQGFGYAFDQTEGFRAALTGTTMGTTKRIDHDWDPGFRIGGGMSGLNDKWDLCFNWTYYHNRSTDSTNKNQRFPGNTGDGLYPLWPAVIIGGTNAFANATGLWRLNLNTLDFELGRGYFNSKALSFRPHWGVRAGWLYQDFATTFRNPFSSSAERDQNFNAEDNYWGVGPRAGIRGDWHLGSNINLFGNIAAALLYGKTYTYILFSVENPDNSNTFVVQNRYRDDFAQLVPTMQIQLGLDWGMCFDGWFFFGLSAAWEVNHWWSRMNLPGHFGGFGTTTHLLSVTPNEPVTTEGVTFSAKLDF